MSAVSVALGRIKRAIIVAVDGNGGVDGAGATTERSRSTAGRWRNINEPDFPPLDAALALDEVMIAQGRGAPILQALAREAGFSLVAHRQAEPGSDEYLDVLADISRRFGSLSGSLAEALADREIDDEERSNLRLRVGDFVDELHALDAMLVFEDARNTMTGQGA